ncbi:MULTISPECIES: MalM family protein [unclassified Agarivorans]|uniref:MalM family protein n=1 Tax=unclassified Agarivorans TaxID=2636026 RepID=UPI003D7DEA2A
MNKHYSLLLISACLVACSSTQAVDVEDPFRGWGSQFSDQTELRNRLDAQQPSVQIEQLSYRLLSADRTNRVDIGLNSSVVEFAEGRSYVAALALPEHLEQVEVEVDSLITNMVFVPTIAVYDKQLQPLAKFNQTTLSAEGFLTIKQQFSPTLARKARYILVYTAHEQLFGKTELIDPKVAYELKMGIDRPAARKVYAKHSPIGQINIRLNKVQFGSQFKATTSNSAGATVLATAAATSLVEPSKVQAVTVLQPATEQFYQQQIRLAIAEGNIEQALLFLKEAEAAGSNTAQHTFTEAIKEKIP